MKGCAKACFTPMATLVRVRKRLDRQSGFPGLRAARRLANPPRPPSHAASGACLRLSARCALLAIFLLPALPAHARPWQRHGAPAPHHPAMGARGHWMGGGFHQQGFPRESQKPQSREAYMRPQQHPGGEHLPQWYQQHQNMPLQQQERALQRQPGFNKLNPAQRKRVLSRLRYLDSQPPAVRARIMARNEAFERLSPERRQEVRAAAQAFQHMPQSRKQQLGRAFNILRTLPPHERTAILNSARFQAQYPPRERHILSNLLSIEPWQPTQQRQQQPTH
jgi:hypothetical protein